MIKSKYFGGILVIALLLAAIFTVILTYFPEKVGVTEVNTEVDMQYETKLFNKDEIMSVNIIIDEDTWNDLLDNALSEEYVVCDIIINGNRVNNVGIRPKGNTSLSQIAMDSTTDRYSFKVEFDHYVDYQTLYGLDKLVLNNIMSDATYMKEYLAYDMLDFMDVANPLYSFANISVNGESWGLYFVLESMEESYAERNFGSDYGNLYKPESTEINGNAMSSNAIGEAVGDIDFSAIKEQMDEFIYGNNQGGTMEPPSNNTNENPGNINGFGNGVGGTTNNDGKSTNDPRGADNNTGESTNNGNFFGGAPGNVDEDAASRGNRGNMGSIFGGSSSTDLQYIDDEISSYSTIFESSVFDTDNSDYERVIEALENISTGTELAKYIDVEQTLKYFAVNTVIVNFDSYVGSLKHNYYLYEKNGQLTMLPWDFNLAFAGFQTNDSSSAINSPIDTPVSGATLLTRPLLGKLLEVKEYSELYHSYLNELMINYFDSGLYEETIEKVDNLISDSVKNDSSAFYTFDEYETGVETILKFGLLRAQSIKGQLDGTIPSTDTEQANNPSALIDATEINISAMGTQGGGRGMGTMPTIPGITDGSSTTKNGDASFPGMGGGGGGGGGNRGERPDMPNTTKDGIQTEGNGNTGFQDMDSKDIGEMFNQNKSVSSSYSLTNIITSLVGFILLIFAIIILRKYKRKRFVV